MYATICWKDLLCLQLYPSNISLAAAKLKNFVFCSKFIEKLAWNLCPVLLWYMEEQEPIKPHIVARELASCFFYGYNVNLGDKTWSLWDCSITSDSWLSDLPQTWFLHLGLLRTTPVWSRVALLRLTDWTWNTAVCVWLEPFHNF